MTGQSGRARFRGGLERGIGNHASRWFVRDTWNDVERAGALAEGSHDGAVRVVEPTQSRSRRRSGDTSGNRNPLKGDNAMECIS